MDWSITSLVNRLTCPAYHAPPDPNVGAKTYPAHLQGLLLHSLLESYLKGEPVVMALNLLTGLPDDPESKRDMQRRALNLLSFANQICEGAREVRAEEPLVLILQVDGPEVKLHGQCDCLVVRETPLVVDWKPAPRPDGLDELQVKCYLAAALVAANQRSGEWVLYYYGSAGMRHGRAQLDALLEEVLSAVRRAMSNQKLQPGPHCARCLHRKECSAYGSNRDGQPLGRYAVHPEGVRGSL